MVKSSVLILKTEFLKPLSNATGTHKLLPERILCMEGFMESIFDVFNIVFCKNTYNTQISTTVTKPTNRDTFLDYTFEAETRDSILKADDNILVDFDGHTSQRNLAFCVKNIEILDDKNQLSSVRNNGNCFMGLV